MQDLLSVVNEFSVCARVLGDDRAKQIVKEFLPKTCTEIRVCDVPEKHLGELYDSLSHAYLQEQKVKKDGRIRSGRKPYRNVRY